MLGDTQSFIVHIWYEETDDETGALVRRGSVEHVSSKRRLFFQDQTEILRFIDEQMEASERSLSHGP